MPHLASATSPFPCDLICFDSKGRERTDDPDGLMSDRVLRTLADDASGVTDVFLLCNGWMGDIPTAKKMYLDWLEMMGRCDRDIASIKQARPNFKPHVVGLHWPSMPFGDESFGDGSFGLNPDGTANADPVSVIVEDYAARVADTPAAREALKTIVTSAMNNVEPDSLSPEVFQAYRQLNREADLGIGGVGATPGADRDGFDPEAVYQAMKDDAPSFGMFSFGGIFGVLHTLSFWRTKDRARNFGEQTASRFLAQMMQAAPRNLRFHLMGHSFGCIVMSAALAGPKGKGRVARPVESLALLQGTLSIWSYCDDIPATPGQPGYFNKVIADKRVKGPILATQSVFDTATGRWYPLGAGVAGQVSFAAPGDTPKYGALGSHGVRGPGVQADDRSLGKANEDYKFEGGKVYNLECSEVIKEGSGRGGSHTDIIHPEIGHAVWQAAIAAG